MPVCLLCDSNRKHYIIIDLGAALYKLIWPHKKREIIQKSSIWSDFPKTKGEVQGEASAKPESLKIPALEPQKDGEDEHSRTSVAEGLQTPDGTMKGRLHTQGPNFINELNIIKLTQMFTNMTVFFYMLLFRHLFIFEDVDCHGEAATTGFRSFFINSNLGWLLISGKQFDDKSQHRCVYGALLLQTGSSVSA